MTQTKKGDRRSIQERFEVGLVYHKSRAEQQAVQCLGHIGSMNVVVVRVVVFTVSSLQCRQELCQAGDWNLRRELCNP